MNDFTSIIIILVTLGFIAGLASLLRSKDIISAELARKTVHIVMGMICATFPWIIENTLSIQLLGIAAILAILIIKKTRLREFIGSALFSVKRLSIGELLFPFAVAWLFTIGQDTPFYYVISILVLTFADASGALIGTKLGKHHYHTTAGKKSVEGSFAFFLTAFMCCMIPLYIQGTLTHLHIILISLAVSSVTTLLEGASGHGSDNLFIPIATFTTLELYASSTEENLCIRLALLIILLFILFASKKLHTLNGGGLIGSVVILFIRYLYVSARFNLNEHIYHSFAVIFCIGVIPLTWLTLAQGDMFPYKIGQVGFIYSISTMSTLLYGGTCGYLKRPISCLCLSPILALVVALPLLLVVSYSIQFFLICVISSLLAVIIYYTRKLIQSEGFYWLSVFLTIALHSFILYFFL